MVDEVCVPLDGTQRVQQLVARQVAGIAGGLSVTGGEVDETERLGATLQPLWIGAVDPRVDEIDGELDGVGERRQRGSCRRRERLARERRRVAVPAAGSHTVTEPCRSPELDLATVEIAEQVDAVVIGVEREDTPHRCPSGEVTEHGLRRRRKVLHPRRAGDRIGVEVDVGRVRSCGDERPQHHLALVADSDAVAVRRVDGHVDRRDARGSERIEHECPVGDHDVDDATVLAALRQHRLHRVAAGTRGGEHPPVV
ncbi:MAG: hypothetical protein WKF58_10980 [Ilumatobacteraceae bacterium]